MRKLAFALTMFGGLLVAGIPAGVAATTDASQTMYAQYRELEGGVRDGRLEGSTSDIELVRNRSYYRYRSPYYYRGGYRSPGYYRGPGYYYRGPSYYRSPGYYQFRYGAPYYGRSWGYGRPGIYFGFGF